MLKYTCTKDVAVLQFCRSHLLFLKQANSSCIHCAPVQLYYLSHVTSTPYKPDTSLRRKVVVGPDGVSLERESSLYSLSRKIRRGTKSNNGREEEWGVQWVLVKVIDTFFPLYTIIA